MKLFAFLLSVANALVIRQAGSAVTAVTGSAPSVPVPGTSATNPSGSSTIPIITQCNRPGVFALTFDDGPSAFTPELLDILKKNNVPATFFINAFNTVGDILLEPYPTILKRMQAEGHHIASHTYDHKDLATLDAAGVTDEMVKNDNVIKPILGVRPRYMRIPFGSYNDQVLSTINGLGYRIIWINVDSMDWDHLGRPDFVELNRGNYSLEMKAGTSPLTNSFISLQHDIHAETVHLWAQAAIDMVRTAGYTFVTVGDCLGEAKENWYRA